MRYPRHGLRRTLTLACLGLILGFGTPGPVRADAPAGELPWTGDLEKALDRARKAGRRVFIDFTGKTCVNCLLNEKNAFPLPEVRQRLLKFELVQLWTDIVPARFYSPEERKQFG